VVEPDGDVMINNIMMMLMALQADDSEEGEEGGDVKAQSTSTAESPLAQHLSA
jgi:hypothetical protein